MPVYTDYSAVPADNNTAPPVGAPEGMPPSSVNDAMRYHMAVTRILGDNTVKQGGSAGMADNDVHIGLALDGSGLLAHVDAGAMGKIWTDSIAPATDSTMTLPNGVKFFWQSITVSTNGSGVGTVVFPAAFSANPVVIICNGEAGSRPNTSLSVLGFSASSFQFVANPSTPSALFRVNYIAIGPGV